MMSATRRAAASFAQERLWFLNRLDPGSAAYTVAVALRLEGPLSTSVLGAGLDELATRHEGLRTRLVEEDGRAVQLVTDDARFPRQVVDLSRLGGHDRAAVVERLAAAHARRPFDLHAAGDPGSLARAAVLSGGPHEHWLCLAIHHAIFDGVSLAIVSGDLSAMYRAALAGRPAGLPPIAATYRQYAVEQRALCSGERLSREVEWWRAELGEAPTIVELPADRPRPARRRGAGRTAFCYLPIDLRRTLERCARAAKATPFAVLLASAGALWHRYTAQDRLLVGIPMSGRTHLEYEPVVGLFVSTLVIQVDCTGDPSFSELVSRVSTAIKRGFDHQMVPFEHLVSELDPVRDSSRTPLVQLWFALQNIRVPELTLGPVRARPIVVDAGTAKFDLSMYVGEDGDELAASAEYDADLFEPARIERMLGHWTVLLTAALKRPAARVSLLPLLTPEEKETLAEWRRPSHEADGTALIPELWWRHADATPDAIAVSTESGALSYRELRRQAAHHASRLTAQGIGVDDTVAIAFQRDLTSMIALMAVVSSGAAFVLIDPDSPTERRAAALRASRARLLLTPADDDPVWAGTVSIKRIVDGAATATDPRMPSTAIAGDALAYVVFTSGTTGVPKGAMNTQAGLRNRLAWMQEQFGLGPGDRVLQKTPVGFDVAVWELLWPLITGATLVMARPGGHRDPEYVHDVMASEQVTTAHFVPSMLAAWLGAGPGTGATLKRVIVSGEALSRELQSRFHARCAAELHNLYGPAEAAIDVTHWPCARDDQRSGVPIGRAIAGIALEVLDPAGMPVPVGIAGELHIGGVGLGRGYAQEPGQTAERFVPRAVGIGRGERLYKTGDLVRRVETGELEFLGRIDHQVKLRGVRVELAEIARRLESHPAVRSAVAAVHETPGREPILVAYVVAEREAGLAAELRDHLRAWLPDAMLPSRYLFLDALPLSANGKLDRRRLPAPPPPDLDRSVEARTQLERAIAEDMADLLGLDRVGVEDNFFLLGGHSLLATQLISRIRHQFGVEVSIQKFFEAPTVAATAAMVGELGAEDGDQPSIQDILAEIEQMTEAELLAAIDGADGPVGMNPR